MMRELYTQVIMDHNKRPRNQGEIEGADVEEHLLNPLCGDEVTIYALFDGEILFDVKFEGRGCAISRASASMMTERLVGKSREEAEEEIRGFKAMMISGRQFPEGDDLAALEGVVRYPSRVKCAILPWTALHNGLGYGDRP